MKQSEWNYLTLVFSSVYLTVSTILFIFDVWLPKWYIKTQIGKRSHIKWTDYFQILPIIIFNLIISWFIGTLCCHYALSTTNHLHPILQIFITIICEEVWFYYTHRLMHYSFMYKSFHIYHHKYDKPIALAALYCHPVEMMIVNTPLNLLGPILTGIQLKTYTFWMIFSAIYVNLNHCGHRLLPFIDTEYHDKHHSSHSVRFGSYLLDYLHGTM